jgi:hypothetical protein
VREFGARKYLKTKAQFFGSVFAWYTPAILPSIVGDGRKRKTFLIGITTAGIFLNSIFLTDDFDRE